MALLFACNAASALMGVAQFYRPGTFNPPVIQVLTWDRGQGIEQGLSIETADGRRVLRPCGLTDSPGGACTGGALACLVGLCWSVRPMAAWKRLGSLGLALVGVAVIYLSQVRSVMVMLVVSMMAMTALLAWRGEVRRAGLIAAGGALALVAGLAWVLRAGGAGVAARFLDLAKMRPDQAYAGSRGAFLQATFGRDLFEYPLGAGLGRWGQAFAYYGDHTPSPDRGMLWAELQWTGWLFDGGVPLMALYAAALAAAVWDAAAICRASRDEEVGFWAAPICALGLSYIALCFNSSAVFIGPAGVQFWALFAALHAAAERARLRARAEALARARARGATA
jgi:hypothetical protein